MLIHFRRDGDRGPLCWDGEDRTDAVMMKLDIEQVTCEECKSLYYLTGKELGVAKASIDLWIDGKEIGDSAGWRQPVNLDWGRFTSDEAYATWVSDHISRTLENLAKEIEEIGIKVPLPICAPE